LAIFALKFFCVCGCEWESKPLTAKIAKKIRPERKEKENAESKPFRQFREG
jgi:hypothetical protein